MKTLVLGASPNPQRYAHIATLRLLEAGHPVVLVGKQIGNILTIPIQSELNINDDIHTITIYLNPAHQEKWYEHILALNPRRIIFNPGTENPVLYEKATARGIEVLEACTLVLLATRQY